MSRKNHLNFLHISEIIPKFADEDCVCLLLLTPAAELRGLKRCKYAVV